LLRQFCAVCADAQACAKDKEKYNLLIISNIDKLNYSAHDCANAQTAQKSEDDEFFNDFHVTVSDKLDIKVWAQWMTLKVKTKNILVRQQHTYCTMC